MVILENIDIDINIDKAILQNIDIDKISNRFKFGISNRASLPPWKSVDDGGEQLDKRVGHYWRFSELCQDLRRVLQTNLICFEK